MTDQNILHKVYLGLGTNLGNKQNNIERALQLLDECLGRVVKVSTLLDTQPEGFASDNSFINGVCLVETPYSPHQVLAITQGIEADLGRTTKSVNAVYADRLIDIDILLYDSLVLDESLMKIPHRLMQQRLFVLEPLKEIASDMVHPVLNKTIGELYDLLIARNSLP